MNKKQQDLYLKINIYAFLFLFYQDYEVLRSWLFLLVLKLETKYLRIQKTISAMLRILMPVNKPRIPPKE